MQAVFANPGVDGSNDALYLLFLLFLLPILGGLAFLCWKKMKKPDPGYPTKDFEEEYAYPEYQEYPEVEYGAEYQAYPEVYEANLPLTPGVTPVSEAYML